MMSSRTVGCALEDAFPVTMRQPQLATYQSKLASAQAQVKSQPGLQQTQAQMRGSVAPVVTQQQTQPQPQPQQQRQMQHFDAGSEDDSDYDKAAYERYKRKAWLKRHAKKAAAAAATATTRRIATPRYVKPNSESEVSETETDTQSESGSGFDTGSDGSWTESETESQGKPIAQPQPRTQPQPQTQQRVVQASVTRGNGSNGNGSSGGGEGANMIVAQGTAYPLASPYTFQSTGQASLATGLPSQGFTVAAASLGPNTPCTPQNPLGVEFGRGSQLYATGYPSNGMPQAVVDGRYDTIRSDRRDLAGTFTDPITGITYAGFTDSMPEPRLMREPPTIKLGEPSRMLEALTGVPQYKRPVRREVLNDFSDVIEGAQIPQGLLELTLRDEATARTAPDIFFTNREVQSGFNDTHWDGFIGDTYVLRPVIDTQTVSDNNNTNTVVAEFRSQPDIYASPFRINDGTHWGGPLQPQVTVLAEDKATGPGRGTPDAVATGHGLRMLGIQQKMPFSDDMASQYTALALSGNYGQQSLASASQSTADSTSVVTTSNLAEMPYRISMPVQVDDSGSGGGGGSGDATPLAGSAFKDGTRGEGTVTTGSMPSRRDGVGTADATAFPYTVIQASTGNGTTGVQHVPAILAATQSVTSQRDATPSTTHAGTSGGVAAMTGSSSTNDVRPTMDAAQLRDSGHIGTRHTDASTTVQPAYSYPHGVSDGAALHDGVAATARNTVTQQYQQDGARHMAAPDEARATDASAATVVTYGTGFPGLPSTEALTASSAGRSTSDAQASTARAALPYTLYDGGSHTGAATTSWHGLRATDASVATMHASPELGIPGHGHGYGYGENVSASYALKPVDAQVSASRATLGGGIGNSNGDMGSGSVSGSLSLASAYDAATVDDDVVAATQRHVIDLFANRAAGLHAGMTPHVESAAAQDASASASGVHRVGHQHYGTSSGQGQAQPVAVSGSGHAADAGVSTRPFIVADHVDSRAYFPSADTGKHVYDDAAQHQRATVATSSQGVSPADTNIRSAAPDAASIRDEGVHATARGAVAGQDFTYAQAGLNMPASESMAGADAAAAPNVHRYETAYDGSAGTVLPSTAGMVGGVETASQRIASHLAFDRSYVESVALPSADSSVRRQRDAVAAPSVNFWTGVPVAGGGASGVWAGVDGATTRDDAPGAQRVEVMMTTGRGDGGVPSTRFASARSQDSARDATASQRGDAIVAPHIGTGGAVLQAGRQDDLGLDSGASTRQMNTFDATTGRDGSMAWAWDGRGQYDDVVRPAAVTIVDGPSMDGGGGGGAAMTRASDRPGSIGLTSTPRVSNDRVLFGTGQSMLPTPNIAVMPSQMDSGWDASVGGDVHVGHTSLLRDAFLKAHPSTYGTAAEFRNTYHTTTRAGIVVPNLQTERAASHPNRGAVETALRQQATRVAAAQQHEAKTRDMHAVRVAYESDAYASDA